MRTLFRAIGNAYKNVTAVKWKSFLASFTILIGSLAISATFTLNKNLDKYVEYLINKDGGARIYAYKKGREETYTKAQMELLNKLPIVRAAYPLLTANGFNLRNLDENARVTVNGLTFKNTKTINQRLAYGKNFSEIEFEYNEPVVLLNIAAVEKLKEVGVIGNDLVLRSSAGLEYIVKVVGVLKNDPNGRIKPKMWTPLPFFKDITGTESFHTLEIIVKHYSWMNWLENYIHKSMKDPLESPDYTYNPLKQYQEKTEEMDSLIILGYILGGLALLAGSVGAMGVMILNINLRKREIGLYKSLGFSSGIVLLQFSLETLILSFVGGIFGAALGGLSGVEISKTILPFSYFSIEGVILGVICAIASGGLFGLIPAWLASRVDPAKALQGA
ncbi:MAG: ABC transporter permease [Bacteriovoracaceae bacterium]|jgi:ABC-type antimicrobial peptide transport system permease subunit|nr:ABC transporter permease [Bacteriovoracaceae bacterium]